MTTKIFQGIEVILVVNFFISVVLLTAGSMLSLSDHYSLFEFNQALYGELISNLKITLVYVAITEIIICAYCFFSKQTQAVMLVGFFLILMVGSVHFYAEINDIEMDENLSLFFLYTGVSHILFGFISSLKNHSTAAWRE